MYTEHPKLLANKMGCLVGRSAAPEAPPLPGSASCNAIAFGPFLRPASEESSTRSSQSSFPRADACSFFLFLFLLLMFSFPTFCVVRVVFVVVVGGMGSIHDVGLRQSRYTESRCVRRVGSRNPGPSVNLVSERMAAPTVPCSTNDVVPVQLPRSSTWGSCAFFQSSTILNRSPVLNRPSVTRLPLSCFSSFGPFATLPGVNKAFLGV